MLLEIAQCSGNKALDDRSYTLKILKIYVISFYSINIIFFFPRSRFANLTSPTVGVVAANFFSLQFPTLKFTDIVVLNFAPHFGTLILHKYFTLRISRSV